MAAQSKLTSWEESRQGRHQMTLRVIAARLRQLDLQKRRVEFVAISGQDPAFRPRPIDGPITSENIEEMESVIQEEEGLYNWVFELTRRDAALLARKKAALASLFNGRKASNNRPLDQRISRLLMRNRAFRSRIRCTLARERDVRDTYLSPEDRLAKRLFSAQCSESTFDLAEKIITKDNIDALEVEMDYQEDSVTLWRESFAYYERWAESMKRRGLAIPVIL
ncbi:hypothetical protein BJ508DRAFT_313591 [Ascobolus immersus RN42]|uniref:Uncharacterized protein n=1 Tax=Ascobolus immersus RN42 TaxID=1160509 RepID=A0A3N4HIF2_ASCIM|nr:hypothetical protein BJ508DRAFT_313591 [Ascobolus immersus RN42]